MNVIYTSENYDSSKSYKRYVRLDMNGTYYWCEVFGDTKNDRRYDYRQGTVFAHEIPEHVRDKADALQGYFPSYVDWP